MPTSGGIAPIGLEDSIETLLARDHTASQAVYLAILTLVVATVGATAATSVDLTIRAPATLVPAIERHTVRAITDGTVDRQLVSMGSVVRAGDTMLVLAASAPEHARSAAIGALDTQTKRRADLRMLLGAERDNAGAPSWRLTALRLEQNRAAANAAMIEWNAGSVQVARAEGLRDRAKNLAARGFAMPTEVELAEFELARAREERALALERQRATWARESADAEQLIAELTRDVAARTSDYAARAIRAPVGGTIEELAPLSTGSAVRAGDQIATISPDGALVAEAFVAPRDVAYLRVGMRMRLLVEGYDTQEWGGADATVTSIGSDYILSDGHPVFRVRARLLRATLQRADGSTAHLGKGLRCQARFLLGRKRIVAIVHRRAREWLDPVSPSAPK